MRFFLASQPTLLNLAHPTNKALPLEKLKWQWKIHHLKMFQFPIWTWWFSNVMIIFKGVRERLLLCRGPFSQGPKCSFGEMFEGILRGVHLRKLSWNLKLVVSRCFPVFVQRFTPLKTSISPAKMMVGRCISYWNNPFLGDMLVFRDVFQLPC